ncbi:unnamed protein product [Schistocephalus solidus]|uniref:BZIP domain-containing protein n=1 Tax=Schistocephalus solidus TaxID=70667 RepID=A0A183SKH7_SCHSO|nr:unnamed protein product [Schistocephalus solidus]
MALVQHAPCARCVSLRWPTFLQRSLPSTPSSPSKSRTRGRSTNSTSWSLVGTAQPQKGAAAVGRHVFSPSLEGRLPFLQLFSSASFLHSHGCKRVFHCNLSASPPVPSSFSLCFYPPSTLSGKIIDVLEPTSLVSPHRVDLQRRQRRMVIYRVRSQVWWYAQGRLRPRQPPASYPTSCLLDSVMTPGSGVGGGESAVAAAQGYYHLKLIHAQVAVPAPPFRGAYGRHRQNRRSNYQVSNRLERRTALVARELARYKVDISALSETKFSEQGQLEEVGAGYIFFWSGRQKAEQRDAGVAFAIRNDIVGAPSVAALFDLVRSATGVEHKSLRGHLVPEDLMTACASSRTSNLGVGRLKVSKQCVESDLNWLLQLTQEKEDYTCNHECSIPAEIVDFVTSYDKCAHGPADLSEFNWLSLGPSKSSQLPQNYFSPNVSFEPITHSNSPGSVNFSYPKLSLSTPRARAKKSSSRPSSTVLDSKIPTEVPANASVKLKKRQSNREAAFRYRQKMKEKYSSVFNDLKVSMLAYNKAKLEYERARDAFDALKKVILDLTPPVHP